VSGDNNEATIKILIGIGFGIGGFPSIFKNKARASLAVQRPIQAPGCDIVPR
jgi:hypothetical protein